MNILVTGAAGFIGHHTAVRFAREGHTVTGLDCINEYYDPRLKVARLTAAGFGTGCPDYGKALRSDLFDYRFVKLDITDRGSIERLFDSGQFDMVCHLAAQAGVRYSIENPRAYVDSNIAGFINMIESSVKFGCRHFVYASSSSVYGLNTKVPFSEHDPTDSPANVYAATKKSNELLAHAYSSIYNIPCTGLRFFTVYGPWGRPDMAPMLFASAISDGKPIKVFNGGDMLRDFTYIDDIVEGIVRVTDRIPGGDVPVQVYNIGCGNPVRLIDFIRELETAIGKEAIMDMLPMQPGDMPATHADCSKLAAATGYSPSTRLSDGIRNFIRWYKVYYGRD